MKPSHRRFSRREFLSWGSSLGMASLLGLPDGAAAEPPPETTRLRIFGGPVTCLAPQYVAEELLLGEGFTDVRYVNYPSDTKLWPPDDLLAGVVDITLSFIPTDILRVDAGSPVVILAGSHAGCVELVASDRVKSTPDLRGKTVGFSNDTRIFTSMFAAYVGIDPQKDINWVEVSFSERLGLFTEGKIDAFMSGPPEALELREKKFGHVLVNTTTDKPWSNYFCCLVTSTREFVRKHPVATKRALRAILKGADVCALEPKRVARLMADKHLASYENTLKVLQELPYAKWRDLDPDDSLRFFALRMRDLGMIKSTPQQIIAQGTDWRFLNELKRELKA